MRKFSGILAAMIMVCLSTFAPATIAEERLEKSAKEYQVKAAFLYNFVKFVEWPGVQALQQTHAANICIIGDEEFGGIAATIFKQASSAQLALNVKLDVSGVDLRSCHVLFISRLEEGHVPSLLASMRSQPVLTVSDAKGFADKGGIIEMVKTEKTIGLFSKDKINLRINLKAAEAEGLRIDADLLKIAAEVIR